MLPGVVHHPAEVLWFGQCWGYAILACLSAYSCLKDVQGWFKDQVAGLLLDIESDASLGWFSWITGMGVELRSCSEGISSLLYYSQ